MRLLSLILQNKKGQNLLISTSPSIPTGTCILYSNFIYQYILESFRRRQKIQRTLMLELNLICVHSINKDYILYVFVEKSQVSLAFDAIKKINQFYGSSAKMFVGSSGAERMEVIRRKFVEFMSVFEQFLYTREISIKEFLKLQPQTSSNHRHLSDEIFNKFNHITNENDRKLIQQSQNISSRIQNLDMKKKIRVIDTAKKLVIKTQDELDLLETDPEKERYINKYRRNIINFANCGRKRQNIALELSEQKIDIEPQELSEISQIVIAEESVIEKEREKIRLKMNEKLELALQNAKIKEVHQFGQVIVEGSQKENAYIRLLNYEQYWKNSKMLNKRISPASKSSVSQHHQNYHFKTDQNYKSKAILDYILRKDTFTPDKIPLLFIYTMQVSSSNIQFTFKYKTNDKWKHRLYDVDISVYLNKQFVVMDCKSIPTANSLKNNRINWRCKEIVPGESNAKGKILLAFGSSNIQPRYIIREIKLSMKTSAALIDGLKAECVQEWGHVAEPERTMVVEYKISPNE